MLLPLDEEDALARLGALPRGKLEAGELRPEVRGHGMDGGGFAFQDRGPLTTLQRGKDGDVLRGPLHLRPNRARVLVFGRFIYLHSIEPSFRVSLFGGTVDQCPLTIRYL